jgi:PIN domain nuclease of toxin-antitoxin system
LKGYLLDTHILLWWIGDAEKLHRNVFNTISDNSNKIYISSASIWEIAIKEALGKLKVNGDLESIIEVNNFLELKISARCASATKKLEKIHRDPFDRILIAQAIENDLTLITIDKYIKQYSGVELLTWHH